jgi:hypothetical protein
MGDGVGRKTGLDWVEVRSLRGAGKRKQPLEFSQRECEMYGFELQRKK